MPGKINLDISFPIIVIIEESFTVFQSFEDFTVCRKSHIEKLNLMRELIIDSEGREYERVKVIPLESINILGGFSLKFAGAKVCYVEKIVRERQLLSNESLKSYGIEIIKYNSDSGYDELPIDNLKSKFELLETREDILRYLFYFGCTECYEQPDSVDIHWRDKRG